ncbi:MAG: extracellular solute-binding protein [Candidatus Cohnella colombiensis]|uniref:Extracellular solute-binding protein n=1 Tax=Candidatus Cohnella colombiensis TaxID=3121368 RepID=A0AA95JBX5_9BACL|nr:MAG: extracellular solute-binding protein [Cohnella sp.]
MKMRSGLLVIAMLILVSSLVGCSSNIDPIQKESTTLKVLAYNSQSFYIQHGMMYNALHPEVEFEVVVNDNMFMNPESDKEKAEANKNYEQSDVLMLSPIQYESMAKAGQLLDLETFIARDKVNLDGIAPSLLSFIKLRSEGKLYGLSSDFYSNAIFYNKDLFEQYGVTLPRDHMDWDELFQLAKRFPTVGEDGEKLYGLKTEWVGDLYFQAMSIANTRELTLFNKESKQMTIDSEAWHNVFNTVLDAMQSGSIYAKQQSNVDPFLTGKVAMSIEYYFMAGRIQEAKNENQKGGVQNWDVVTVPVDPLRPNMGGNLAPSVIMAINPNSTHIEEAWEFLKYLMSEDYAKVMTKANFGSLTAHTKYIKDDAGHHLEAFYKLEPTLDSIFGNVSEQYRGIRSQIENLLRTEIDKVKEDQQTVAEALSKVQIDGQVLLLSIKE